MHGSGAEGCRGGRLGRCVSRCCDVARLEERRRSAGIISTVDGRSGSENESLEPMGECYVHLLTYRNAAGQRNVFIIII